MKFEIVKKVITEITSYLLYIGLNEDQPNDQQNGENYLIHDEKL